MVTSEDKGSVLPSSGKMSKFDTGAVRDAMEGKGLPSLIPTCALKSLAKRFEDGATKYGRDNWQQGIPLSRYCDSAHRHLWALRDGQTDEGHFGAVLWNIACWQKTKEMIDSDLLPKHLDDLPK